MKPAVRFRGGGRPVPTPGSHGCSAARAAALVLATACVLAAVGSLPGCAGRNPRRAQASRGAWLEPLEHGRILLIAPHPDDEGLAGGGLIQMARSEGVDIRVAVLTCGDSSPHGASFFSGGRDPAPEDYRRLGNARVRETRHAMKEVGLPAADVSFFGYADGSLNSLWDDNWDYDNLRMGRNGNDRSPYPFSYERRAPYCGRNLEKNLLSAIKRYRPSVIVYPDEEDFHHDHWAANAFVQEALLLSRYKGLEYTYLVHRPGFPYPRGYDPSGSLAAPDVLRGIGTTWKSLVLSGKALEKKGRALREYAIPLRIKDVFVESFVRRNELFGVTREASPARPAWRPDLSGGKMPCVVARDPWNDSYGPGAGEGELVKVSFGLGRSRAYMGLETAGAISLEVDYVFRVRILRRGSIDRYDIRVRNNSATCDMLASNSRGIRGRIPVVTAGRRLLVDVPASLFEGGDRCLLSIDAMAGHHRLDRTAYRRISLRR